MACIVVGRYDDMRVLYAELEWKDDAAVIAEVDIIGGIRIEKRVSVADSSEHRC